MQWRLGFWYLNFSSPTVYIAVYHFMDGIAKDEKGLEWLGTSFDNINSLW